MYVFDYDGERFEPQNVEQGISNVEVNTSSFCGSLFDIRHSPFSADQGGTPAS
jgi:hypothetical protein